jgi:hypothetical protein
MAKHVSWSVTNMMRIETQQETSILTCRRGEGLAINKFFAFANISISVLKIL